MVIVYRGVNISVLTKDTIGTDKCYETYFITIYWNRINILMGDYDLCSLEPRFFHFFQRKCNLKN